MRDLVMNVWIERAGAESPLKAGSCIGIPTDPLVGQRYVKMQLAESVGLFSSRR